MSDLLTKKQKKELQKLIDDVSKEAKLLVDDYEKNPSNISGSYIHVHENSSILDESE